MRKLKKCIRCGKDIDVISRNPEKVFYCRSCSLQLLNLTEDDLNFEEEEIIAEESTFWIMLFNVIKSLIPGLFQILNKEILKGLIFLFSGVILPLAWIFTTVFSIIIEVNEGVKFILFIMGFLVLINGFLVFIKNLIEVWKRGEH